MKFQAAITVGYPRIPWAAQSTIWEPLTQAKVRRRRFFDRYFRRREG